MKNTALLALALTIASAAPAQETGTLLNRGPTVGANGRGPDDARAVMLGYAACVAGRYSGRVKVMLDLPVTDPMYKKMHESMFQQYSDCLSGGNMSEINFSDVSLRGALFEAVYRREFGHAAIPAFAGLPPIDYLKGYTPPFAPEATAAIALARFGECIVRGDATDARGIVMSAPGSVQEKQSFAGVIPHLSACLVKGEQMRFSKTILRGAMAEGLYRLTASVTPQRAG